MNPRLRLHHVGYAVKSIPATASAYIDRYGYQAASPVIHDPLQTAHVQFLHLPGDTVFLELVAPDGAGSKLEAAARRGGLNHLCYIARDLDSTIPSLESTGMRLISEPKPATAFAGRRICWLIGEDPLPIELVEAQYDGDDCAPATESASLAAAGSTHHRQNPHNPGQR
jgi:methylmalonyl-CoA/ethylmalonyl-CoA epimerase